MLKNKGERKMDKKILCVAISLALMLTLIPIASVSAQVPNPSKFTVGTIGEPETVDPQWLYDTASSELVWNVYDQLMAFYVDRSLPRAEQGRAEKNEANLAYEWYLDDTTDPDHPVFYFRIRGSHDHFITVISTIPPFPYPVPITVPVSTVWVETQASEEPDCSWHIWKWEDNNADGFLSACDIVKMDKLDYEGPDVAPWLAFHVQEMYEQDGLWVMYLKELPVPFQILRTVTLPVGFNKYEPVSFTVTETTPVAGRQYHIDEWEDGMFGPYNGEISAGDVIQMTRAGTPPVEYPNSFTRDYVVESIVGNIMVVKPCLTCWDIEYTFERWFVLDHSGGPQWMIYEVLAYPEYSWPDANPDEEIYEPDPAFAPIVDAAIETNCHWVWFTFAIPYATAIFKQVVTQSWASILYMDWAMDQGCWNGDWATVATYHDPDVSPLMDPLPVMCGTGPFYFIEWISGSHWRIERFVEHWQQWPPRYMDGYVDVVIERFISEWPTRKLMFLAGDLDFCYVPRQYKADVLDKPGIRCDPDLPGVSEDGIFYNLKIESTSRYLYAPFIEHLADGVIKETGIPADFFSDINVRKAFSYCINYTEFQDIAFLGEAIYPVTPLPEGPAFGWARHDEAWYLANRYNLDLDKAEYYFKLAWGGVDSRNGTAGVPVIPEDSAYVTPGELWTKGFTLPLTYNTGNVARKTICEDYLEVNVESLNTKFHIDVYDVEWGTVYIPELFTGELTMFIIGWVADYLDPHNFMFTFMHTYGSFSYFQAYSDPHVDALLDEGMMSTNTTRRVEIYQELEEIYIRDVPSVCHTQPLGRHWERTWVYGWYYNAIYPGYYFKHYWKAPPVGVTIEEVDVSALASVSPPVGGSYVVVGLKGYMKPKLVITVDASVVASNPDVPGFFVVIGFTRTLTSEGLWVVIDMDYLWMTGGTGSTVDATFTWNETIDSGSYNMGGAAGVSSGTVVDNNATNNNVQDASGDVLVVNIAPGDFDENLDVSFTDLFVTMIGTYYYNYQLNHTLYDERADFNLDGKIDFTDVFVYMVGMYYYGYWFYFPWP
jgi:peptide/nickel transport system substrate-binding protein